jgi:iron complex outermembrane recepter protein
MITSGCLLALSVPAAAQRAEENVTTAAGDAFGKAVGNERVGIYSPDDVRGFNPIEAGNARIEGLYFDQQDRPTPRLISGSTIRVGITAQGYPFPAPTGIVDYGLRISGAEPQASLEIERTAFGGTAIAVDTSLPLLGETLGLNAGAIARRLVSPQGGSTIFLASGMTLTGRPYADAAITAFWSQVRAKDDEATPLIFPAGNLLPPKFRRSRFFGQRWAQRNSDTHNYGLLAKLPIKNFRIEAGLFRSRRDTASIYSDLLRGTDENGNVANRVIVADRDNLDDSISGEIRVAHVWTVQDFRHNVYATFRGRVKNRDFGGQDAESLGATSLRAPKFEPQPVFSFRANNLDRVRQTTYGFGYGVEWARRGSLDLALAKTDYSKRIDFVNSPVPRLEVDSSPLLYSANGSLSLSPKLALYGGYVRGLEESLIAPEIAINRGEAPPAILTRQIDAGLRLVLTPKLTLIAGVFSVKKPYFNLDNDLRFGQLGNVENRGIELSLAGQLAPGTTVIAGTAFLDPSITGEAVASGIIGPRPVGSVRRRSILNLDWRPVGQTRWSFDLAVESFSSRIGNASNSLIVPARSTLALGTRYRFKLGPLATLIRVQATNVLNEYGWLVNGSGGFTYSPHRAVTAELSFDL